jgi:hypothetical protein
VHAISSPAAHAPRRWLHHRCSEMPFDVIAASSWRTASTSRERRTKHGHLEFADRHTDKGSFRRARRLQRRGGDSCTDDPKPFLEELATDSAKSLNVYRVSPRLLSTTTIPLGKSDQSYDGLGRECIHSPDGTPDPTAANFVGFVPLPAKEPMLHPKVLPNTDLGLAR